MFLKKRTSSVHLRFQTTLLVTIPWSQRFSFNIIFSIWKFATRSADGSPEPREKKASGQDR